MADRLRTALIPIVALLILFACSPQKAEPTTAPTFSPTATPSFTPTPSSAPTPTQTPSPSPTPTPAFPLLPAGLEIITPDNARQLMEISRIGKGLASGLAWSPDGTLLAVGSSPGISLYDAQSMQEIRFIDTGYYVTDVIFSPDGQSIFSGSYDGTVKMWQVADGTLLRTFGSKTGKRAVWALSPDGATLALNAGGTVQFRRVTDGSLAFQLHTLNKNSGCIAFSPDGTILATGGWDDDYNDVIRLWRISDGALLRTLEGFMVSVHRLAFSPDGRFLAAGSNGGVLNLWRVSDGAHLLMWQGGHPHASGVMGLGFLPDGVTLAAVYTDDSIDLWQTADNTIRTVREWIPDEAQCLVTREDDGSALAVSPDGAFLASRSCSRKTIDLWRISDGIKLHTLEGYSDGIGSIESSPDGKLLAAGSRGGTVSIWDISDGTLRVSRWDMNLFANTVTFSPDGARVGWASYRTANIWDVSKTNFPLWELDDADISADCADFSPSGTIFITGGDRVRFWWSSNGELMRVWENPEGWGHASNVVFSPDGSLLAVGYSRNDSVALRRLSDGGVLHAWENISYSDENLYEDFEYAPNRIAFSPDGTVLAAGVSEKIKLFRVSDGTLLLTLKGNQRAIDLAFSPRGDLLASAADGIRIWRVSDGALLTTLTGHSEIVTSVFFSPDGAFLGSGSYDGTIRFWAIA